jgi:hypothetical protein
VKIADLSWNTPNIKERAECKRGEFFDELCDVIRGQKQHRMSRLHILTIFASNDQIVDVDR